jgi:hypothetical protein
MKPTRTLLILALIIAAATPFDAAAQANYRGHYGHRGYYYHGRGYRSGYSPVGKAYADIMRANAIRAAAVRAAQAEVNRAHYSLQRTRTKIEREFKYSADMNAAEADLAKAYRQLEAARTAARDKLGGDPNYQAAKLAKDGQAIIKMHSAAYRADSGVQVALRDVSEVAVRITALKRQFEGSVTSNSQWIAASKNLENARSRLAQSYAAGNSSLAAASSRTNRYSRR